MGLFNSIIGKMLNHGKGKRSAQDIAFEEQVKRDGVPHAAFRIAEILNEKIYSKDLAEQFVLEELDAAKQGDDIALAFVRNSGYQPSQYVGAMNKTAWEGNESDLEHIQLLLRHFTYRIQDNELAVKLMTSIVDEIMKLWRLGRYV